jgi:hypothetical protein
VIWNCSEWNPMMDPVFQVSDLRNDRTLVRYFCLIFGDRLLYIPEAALVFHLFYTRCCSSALKKDHDQLRHFKFIIHIHPLIACYMTCAVYIQKQNSGRCKGLWELCAGQLTQNSMLQILFFIEKVSEVDTEILQGFIETRRRRRYCLKMYASDYQCA